MRIIILKPVLGLFRYASNAPASSKATAARSSVVTRAVNRSIRTHSWYRDIILLQHGAAQFAFYAAIVLQIFAVIALLGMILKTLRRH